MPYRSELQEKARTSNLPRKSTKVRCHHCSATRSCLDGGAGLLGQCLDRPNTHLPGVRRAVLKARRERNGHGSPRALKQALITRRCWWSVGHRGDRGRPRTRRARETSIWTSTATSPDHGAKVVDIAAPLVAGLSRPRTQRSDACDHTVSWVTPSRVEGPNVMGEDAVQDRHASPGWLRHRRPPARPRPFG